MAKKTRTNRKITEKITLDTKKSTETESFLLTWIRDCREEADTAKEIRMHKNKVNFDVFHLRQDYTHKEEGQSREVLSKQSMAVEQISSFFQQALADTDEWWKAEAANPKDDELMKIRPHEITKLTNRQLEKANVFTHIGHGMKTGLLGSLIISKVTGKQTSDPKFRTKTSGKGKDLKQTVVRIADKSWQLELSLVRQENFYPDPTGCGLYEIEDQWLDLHEVKQLAEGADAIYDKDAVDLLSTTMSETASEEFEKLRETDQTSRGHNARRPRVKLTEYWGDVIDKDGNVVHENIVMTMANDKTLIRKPTPNPFWHGESPFVVTPLIEVPHSVWHKALMDAPTMHNIALNELYNLLLDGAMKQANNITEVRVGWLEDPSQVANGIKPGDALKLNDQAPPGASAINPVQTGDVPRDGLSMLNVVQQEFNASALTNDLRQGVIPFRQVKATEVVEASQTITSVFQGLAKNVEQKWVQGILRKSWMLTAQRMDDLNAAEIEVLLGKERTEEIKAMTPQERFVETVNGVKYRVFGVTKILSKQQDFRKWTTLLQTVVSSEPLLEAFLQKFSFAELMGEIMGSLNIDKHKIELPSVQAEADLTNQTEERAEETVGQLGTQPDLQSQIPQAGGQSLGELFGESPFPQADFPGSPATAGGQ